jgi:hypothetical protein
MPRSSSFRVSVWRSYSARWLMIAARSSSGSFCASIQARPFPPNRSACGQRGPKGACRIDCAISLSRTRLFTSWLRRVTCRRRARRRLVWDPDLGQKARGVELGKYAGIDLVRPGLRSRDQMHLERICSRHPFDLRRKNFQHRCRVACRLDDHVIGRVQGFRERTQVIPRHPDTPNSLVHTVPKSDRFSKCPMYIEPNHPHRSLLPSTKREPAGTRHLQIRALGTSGQAAGATT